MFKTMMLKPYRVPAYTLILFGASALYFAGIAYGQTDAAATATPPEPTLEYLKSVIGTIVTVAGFISLMAGIVIGLLNKNNTDRLKANIAELEDIVETKERRNTELKLTHEAEAAKSALSIAKLEKKLTVFEVSNESVVEINLQMKAILRGLRLSGQWAGHEDDIFIHKTNR
jgi:uncharacterized protein involved in exopolysaccharide biosynthesis